MTNLPYSSWQEPYLEALLEPDPEKLKKKIEDAEIAIFQRLQSFGGNNDHSEERIALDEAIRTLRELQVQKLNFPTVPDRFIENQ